MPAELPGLPNQPLRFLRRQVLARPPRSIRRAFRHDFPVFDVWADVSLGPQCDDVVHADAPHFRYLGPFTECLPPFGLSSSPCIWVARLARTSFGEAPENVCPPIQPCLKIGSSAASGGKKSLPVPVFAPVEVREDG